MLIYNNQLAWGALPRLPQVTMSAVLVLDALGCCQKFSQGLKPLSTAHQDLNRSLLGKKPQGFPVPLQPVYLGPKGCGPSKVLKAYYMGWSCGHPAMVILYPVDSRALHG